MIGQITNKELMELLKKNIDFLNYFIKSRELQATLSNAFLSERAKRVIKIEDIPDDLVQITRFLNLPEKYTVLFLN